MVQPEQGRAFLHSCICSHPPPPFANLLTLLPCHPLPTHTHTPHTHTPTHPPSRRFLEDHIHAKEVLVEKLTLKNATYKAAVSKLEAQLAHKEEMGEVLHLVDFDQLKIENQQYMERIAAKNQELLQLKLSAGHAVQVRAVVRQWPWWRDVYVCCSEWVPSGWMPPCWKYTLWLCPASRPIIHLASPPGTPPPVAAGHSC